MNKRAFRAVLWDIDADKIDTLPVDFVLQRVLTYGTIGLILLSIKESGFDAVKKAFGAMKTSSLSAKKYIYLKNYLLA